MTASVLFVNLRGLARTTRLCSGQRQPRPGIMWTVCTHQCGGRAWLLAGTPTSHFHVSWSSSQYGSSVPREPSRLCIAFCDLAAGVLWHRVLCILLVQAVRKACPASRGEEIDSASWWGNWRVLEGNVGLEILPWPLLNNIVSATDHKQKVNTPKWCIRKRSANWESENLILIPPLPITNCLHGPQCAHLLYKVGDTNAHPCVCAEDCANKIRYTSKCPPSAWCRLGAR